jgi:hypothetical protein
LENKPSIPEAKINSDWTSTTGLAVTLHKPTLFSGSYTDFTNKPNFFSGNLLIYPINRTNA